MLFSLLNFFKGRVTKEAINDARNNKSRMSRQEALQQMRNLASKRTPKDS
ncbi:hypothetical protein [Telluribacter sp.]|jgi:hypothetical protein|nr:hypothetical protein [Telluribacter sp.]